MDARKVRIYDRGSGKQRAMALVPRPVVAASERLAAAGFGSVAALRRGRAVHTRGCSFHAEVHLLPAAARLWGGTSGSAIVRLSKGGGFPEPVPDILGVAVRLGLDGVDGAPIDLLAASSLAPPATRHLLVPARRFDRAFFSSLTPYDTIDGLRLYGCRVEGPMGVPLTLEAMRRRGIPPQRVLLAVASLGGRWQPAGTVELGDRLDPADSEGLRFNPWHTTEPFRPVGAFNVVRDAAYLASQKARGAASPASPERHREHVR